ncbi:MAG: ATP-binding protein, partial [Olleya sp.]
ILLYLFFYVRKNRKQITLKLELENQKEITQVKNKIIENLSHEIRTPISVINGYLDLISQNSLYPNKIIEFVKIGDRNLKLLIENLNNFLALQKIDENNIFPDTKKKKKLNLFLKNTVASFAANAQLKNIGLHYTSNLKDDLKVDFEYHKLEKIVNNLINNALKFTEPGKDIYVKAILDKSHLHFIVKDEGKGISKEEQQFIFDRFYQSKNNNETGGFGIGLALVKSIVESMGGNIVLKSEENMGTIFEIALPITKIENIDLYLKPEEHNIISFNKVVDQEITNISNFPKVLIVDDNVEMTNYLYTLLNSFLDCTIVYNGKEALKKIEKTKYDLIISDYKMPIMDGKTLKATLNKVKEFETIPFIMLTATPVANFASLGLTLGINDYIIKPFSNNELIARIRTILENKLLQIKIQNKDTNIQFDGYTSELIEKVNVLVLKNLENPNFNVLDLANACGYGQKQFGRIIKAKTGMTAVNLILEIKLLKAYELLQINTFSTIKEVMYTIGLTNRSYFNKAFFKRFGVKPSELIKKYSNT